MPPVPDLLPVRQWVVDYAMDLLESERLHHRFLGTLILMVPVFNDMLVDMFELEYGANLIALHLIVLGAVGSFFNNGGLSSAVAQWIFLCYLATYLPVYVQTGHITWRTASQIWLVMFCMTLHTTRIVLTS